MANSPYAAAPEDRLKKIVSLAESRLAAQLTLGIAADQRAMTFASFLATLEAAAIAALVALPSSPAGKGALIAIVGGFGVATLLAVLSAQPVAWDIPGYRPNSWLRDIASSDTDHDERAAMAGHYDEMIVDNDETMKSNALMLRLSLWLVVVTLAAAAVAAVWAS
jgi:hypothetical protein